MEILDQKKLKKLLDEITSLDSREGIVENDSFPMNKSSKREIEKFESAAALAIPESIQTFFQKVGIFTIHWKYNNLENKLERGFGNSNIYSLGHMLDHPDPNIDLSVSPKYEFLLWNQGDDKDLVDELQNFYPLDDLFFDNFVLIKFVEGKGAELYLYTRAQNLSRLKLGFSEYILKQLEYKGLYFWQQYYLSNPEENPIIPDNFHRNINSIFPEIDISEIEDQANRPELDFLIEIPDSKKNYLTRFLEMIEGLKANKKIEQVNESVNNFSIGTHPGDFYRAFLAIGYGLPKECVLFFQEIHNLSLSWISNSANRIDSELAIPPFEELFVQDDGIHNWSNRRKWTYTAVDYFSQFDYLSAEELEIYQDYRIFYLEERNKTLIKFNEDGSCNLALTVDYDFYPLQLTFEDYIEALLEFRGAKNWQYLFVKPDDRQALGLGKDYLREIRTLFPDIDLNKFKQYLDGTEI